MVCLSEPGTPKTREGRKDGCWGELTVLRLQNIIPDVKVEEQMLQYAAFSDIEALCILFIIIIFTFSETLKTTINARGISTISGLSNNHVFSYLFNPLLKQVEAKHGKTNKRW